MKIGEGHVVRQLLEAVGEKELQGMRRKTEDDIERHTVEDVTTKINQSINQSINRSINQSINQSTNRTS